MTRGLDWFRRRCSRLAPGRRRAHQQGDAIPNYHSASVDSLLVASVPGCSRPPELLGKGRGHGGIFSAHPFGKPDQMSPIPAARRPCDRRRVGADLAGHRVTAPYRASHSVLVDGHPVRLLTEPLLLDDLGSGDWFIGPFGELYEVSCPAAATHPNGWTEVTNLSTPVETERVLLDESGGGEPDNGPGEEFSPGQDVVVERVLELVRRPARPRLVSGERRCRARSPSAGSSLTVTPARADGGPLPGPGGVSRGHADEPGTTCTKF